MGLIDLDYCDDCGKETDLQCFVIMREVPGRTLPDGTVLLIEKPVRTLNLCSDCLRKRMHPPKEDR